MDGPGSFEFRYTGVDNGPFFTNERRKEKTRVRGCECPVYVLDFSNVSLKTPSLLFVRSEGRNF